MKFTDKDGEITETPFVRDPFNYNRNKASDETALDCQSEIDENGQGDGASRTKQEFAEDADINVIVRRFGLTGQLPENVRVPQSMDFEEVFDFQSAMNVIRESQETFMEMPADIRERFDNDAGKFLAFVNNEDNYEVAKKWGIVVPQEPPKAPEAILVRMAEVPEKPVT